MNFFKYQGTGNDFVMIDNRDNFFPVSNLSLIRKICHRKFGIGADGLILLQNKSSFDFEMIYFNPDGTQSLCGNGSRCAVKFANFLGLINQEAQFLAVDGSHYAFIATDRVHLKMHDIAKVVRKDPKTFFINTGSPHHICWVNDVKKLDVYQSGRTIRYSEDYEAEGTNVNFAEVQSDATVFVRTYERGVEDETLSCGTGVTAVALSSSFLNSESPVRIKTLGGELEVSFQKDQEGNFSQIFLIGPAEMVFAGEYEI